MTYRIGQTLPPPPVRPVQTGAIEPAWFVFVTPPQAEGKARAWLERRGVTCWYPSETGWRRQPRSRVKRVAYERRIVPRYLFARFTGRPVWHEVRSCRWISRAVGHDGVPLPVSDEVMAEMAAVPQVLAQLRARQIAARTIQPGDRARVLDGPLAGWVVEVTEVRNGIARFLLPLLGGAEGEAHVAGLDKRGVD